MMDTKGQYGWIRINGEYFIYDRKRHNIPVGMSRPYKTKAEVLEAIRKAGER